MTFGHLLSCLTLNNNIAIIIFYNKINSRTCFYMPAVT